MLEDIKTNWKKQAAAMMGAPQEQSAVEANALEIERAFMQQSYNRLEAKAAPLLKPEYRLGFEVVFNNDDNTKMVGIFAFKLGGELLFVPTFFTASDIKGVELLYRSKTKSFTPLTAEWCKHAISEVGHSAGHLVEPNMHRPNTLDIEKIVFPPGMAKNACKQAYADMTAKLLFEDEEDTSTKLASYIADAGPDVAAYVREKLANDDEFAEAVYLAYTEPENWLPAALAKKASTSAKPVLEFIRNSDACSEEELEEFYKSGFFIRDSRDEDSVVKTAGAVQDYKEGADLGVNKVFNGNAAVEELLYTTEFERYSQAHDDYPPAYIRVGGKTWDEDVAIQVYSFAKGCLVAHNADMANVVVDNSYIDSNELLEKHSVDVPKANSGYLIVSKKGFESDRVYLTKEAPESTKKVKVFGFSRYPEDTDLSSDPAMPCCGSEGSTIVFSSAEGAESDRKRNVYRTEDFWLLPIAVENSRFKSHSFTPMTFQQVFHTQKHGNANLNAIEIVFDDVEFRFKMGSTSLPRLSEASLQLALCKECNLSKEAAVDIIHAAKKSNLPKYFLVEKTATSLSFGNFPDLDTSASYDSVYDVMSEDASTVDIVESDGIYETPRTLEEILKAENNVTEASTMGGMHPTQIADIANRSGVQSIFDHGVIASLTKTFDTRGLMETYMVDFDTALDKLGRLVFLFYWKPKDFLALYGSDDQNSIENMLISNFTSFGDMILELKQKNKEFKDENTGTSPLPV